MNLPEIILLSDSEASKYIDKIFNIFQMEVVNGGLEFLGLPIKCPWHPSSDNKHFCFWHLISEKNETGKECDRIHDPRRCERISWISYVIQNANNKTKIWCWEKEIRTKRGRNKHIHLYLHEECYMVILRRKSNRLELVTTFVVSNHQRRVNERQNGVDPRKAEVA
jgi:uncharacterized protein YlaI